MRIAIFIEHLDRIQKTRPDDRIAANPDTSGLSDPQTRQLIHRFIRQSSAAADDAHMPLLVNRTRHNSDFAFSRRNNSRTIRPNQSRPRIFQSRRHAHHVQSRHALGDANHQRQTSVHRLQNRIGRKWRRHKNHRHVRFRSLHRFRHGIEYGHFQMFRPALPRRNARHHFRPVIQHLLRVKTPLAARDSLHDQPRILINQHAHRAPPASATAFSAPSFIPSATAKLNPELRKMSLPCCTLVPSMRTTTGTLNFSSFAAPTTPLASTSQRKIPPKMFTNTARTFGSLSKMRNAFFTCSSEAPPPTSRKFAGLPPLNLMMSIVAIANPAPFTMQAISPSSLM